MDISKEKVEIAVHTTFREHNVLESNKLYDSHIWRKAFIKVFGEEPKSNNDERWDQLFDQEKGLGALKIASEYQKGLT